MNGCTTNYSFNKYDKVWNYRQVDEFWLVVILYNNNSKFVFKRTNSK